MTRSSRRDRRLRGGFTLVEMAVVCFMSALLASMMAGAWAAFGGPAVDVDARCRIAQEASLAAETLGRDLSGYEPGSNATPGDLGSGNWTGRSAADNQLSLQFGADVIVYQLVADRLVRTDQNGTTTTVARYLSSFQVTDQGASEFASGSVQIQLSFSYRSFQRTYYLIGVMP